MEVTVIRSNRKTIAIQVKPDLTVTVRAPLRCTKREIDHFLAEKEEWILRAMEKMRRRQEASAQMDTQPMSDAELRDLAKRAAAYIPERAAYWAKFVGVTYGRITIRHQRTRWGSCSSKGNLNFNCLLMLAPPEVIDYVVVHELCHRKEMNHSKAFWSEVERVLPDYRTQVRWLKENGGRLMSQKG